MPDITKTLADALRAFDGGPVEYLAGGIYEVTANGRDLTAARDALALYDAAAVTQGAGTEEVERALSVGALMANVMFNLKQGQSSGERERAIYADLQRQWDAAVGPARAALAARAASASTKIVGYVLLTGHGVAFRERLPDESQSLRWAGKPMWRPVVFMDAAPSSPSAEPQAGGAK